MKFVLRSGNKILLRSEVVVVIVVSDEYVTAS